MSMWNTLRRRLSDLDRDDLLDLVGMQTRRSTADEVLPAVLMFTAGVAVGVGIGLMIAPRSGAELREELSTRLRQGTTGAPVPVPSATTAG